jgi:hypothetical protein
LAHSDIAEGRVETVEPHGSESASIELAEARALAPDGRFSNIDHVRAAGAPWSGYGYWGVPEVRALFEATYFAGLHKAGIPEE